jgi:hypothetical protein
MLFDPPLFDFSSMAIFGMKMDVKRKLLSVFLVVNVERKRLSSMA